MISGRCLSTTSLLRLISHRPFSVRFVSPVFQVGKESQVDREREREIGCASARRPRMRSINNLEPASPLSSSSSSALAIIICHDDDHLFSSSSSSCLDFGRKAACTARKTWRSFSPYLLYNIYIYIYIRLYCIYMYMYIQLFKQSTERREINYGACSSVKHDGPPTFLALRPGCWYRR